jgi:hypothetical protein
MFHLMTDHSLLQGHQLRLAQKRDPHTAITPDHLCRLCERSPETLQHLLGDCPDDRNRSAYSKLKVSTHMDDPRFQPGLGKLLTYEENWPAWIAFFNDMEMTI